jgi:hypothetical protein
MTDSALDSALPWPRAFPARPSTAETTAGGSQPARWLVVAHHLTPTEALVIKSRLDSEDIPAVIQQEALGAVLGLTIGPLASATVLVPEALAEKAAALLAETFDDEPWDGEDSLDELDEYE